MFYCKCSRIKADLKVLTEHWNLATTQDAKLFLENCFHFWQEPFKAHSHIKLPTFRGKTNAVQFSL